MRRFLAIVVLLCATAAYPLIASAASILSASIVAGKASVPATGASVTIRATLSGATRCSWTSSPAIKGFNKKTTCSPRLARVAKIPANDRSTKRKITFTFDASTASEALRVHAVVLQDARISTSSTVPPTTTPTTTTTIPTTTTTTTPPPLSSFSQSMNWAGYILPDTNGSFTLASGDWTVPTLNCAETPNGGASTWVGIGGATLPDGQTSGTLLQTGITDQCTDGEQNDFGWWEEYPSQPNIAQQFVSFTVSPGNNISASVTFNTTTDAWQTELNNAATGYSAISVVGDDYAVYETSSLASSPITPGIQGTSTGLTYSGGSTAEWIIEDYESDNNMVPFANFSSETFSNLNTSLSGWALSLADGIALVQDQQVLALPSAPSADGFSLSYGG